MRKMILVFGLPGTGKTTFADALSDAVGMPHFNSDIVREMAGLRGRYDTASKEAVYRLLLEKVENCLKEGQGVVIDATFYKKSLREPYLSLADQYRFQVKWIQVLADEETVKQRVSKKRAHTDADFEVYQKIKIEYEPLDMPALALRSDQLSVAEMVEQALAHLSD